MTTTEHHSTAVDLGDITLAAEVVVAAGYASQKLVQRKLRVSWDTAGEILEALEWCGVVGPPDDEGTYPVLAVEDELADLLARLQEPLVEPDDDTVEEAAQEVVEPVRVSLEKPHQPTVVDAMEDDEGDPPGDELELRQPGEVERYDATPTPRQQLARMWARVVDEPAVLRTRAVTRQAPKAGARLVIWTPRGAVRVVAMYVAYLRDAETLRLLAHHEQQGLGLEYAKVARARQDKNVAGRQWLHGLIAALLGLVGLAWWAPQVFAGILAATAFLVVLLVGRSVCRDPKELAGMTVAALALGGLAWWQGPHLAALIPQPPGWVWIALAVVAVVVFGVAGRKEDQHLVEMPPNMASTKPPIITAPMMIGALVALGNTKMRDPDSIRVLGDPHRTGMFVQIDLELPAGVTAAWVVENREPLAAAMRRPMSMVWPRVGNAHPGHLTVLGSEEPMNEMQQEPWPLLAVAGPIDIFTPQPVFTNQLGEWVKLTLAYASWVIGAVPRMGKTYTVRQLLLIFAMDPRVKVIALDGKGTGDLSPLVPVAHLHVRGARVDKPESIEQVRGLVRGLLREMGRRADVLAELPFEEVPDSKVTSELINAHPDLDLGPIVLGIDETQSFFSYGFRGNKEHKEIREEIRDGVIELMRMGPALGIWVIMATQTVRDSTIPTEAQAVAVYRYGMKMESHEPNDKVLGTGAHRAGTTATIFGFEEKGIGWFKGEGAKPFIARSVFGLDAVASRSLATKARTWRVARGLLTGEAAGDEAAEAEVVIDIARDVEQVLRGHQRGRAQHVELVGWLKDLRADNYSDLDVEELSARLRGAGVPIRQVRIDGINRKGVRLSDLQVSTDGDGGDEGDASDA